MVIFLVKVLMIYRVLFCDSPDRVNVYHYLTYLLEKRPNDRMSDKEFEQLAPWNEEVKAEIKRRAANLKK